MTKRRHALFSALVPEKEETIKFALTLLSKSDSEIRN